MNRTTQYRLLVIILLAAGSGLVWWLKGINLGLDLQGGIHLIVQVETSEAMEAEVDQVRERIASRLTDKEIAFDRVAVTEGLRVEVTGVPDAQDSAARDELEDTINWSSTGSSSDGFRLSMQASARKHLLDLTVRQAREVIQKRIDQYGVVDPTIAVYGSGEVKDQIVIELPGVEDFDRVKRLIGETANLELKLVHPDQMGTFPSPALAAQAFGGKIPDDYEVHKVEARDQVAPDGSIPDAYMVLKKAAAITGRHLKNAQRSEDPYTGKAEVAFFLNGEGVQLFSEVTAQNVNRLLGIVLDDLVRSTPRIEGPIRQESARITGNFTRQEAEDLALVLRSGALPASIRFLENRQIGPSLGADSIRHGLHASILGLVLVVLGMLVVYKISGLNAILCLGLNLFFLAGSLSYLGATLTLPGIAGVILTIGMAVDANILIFERIKEELRSGKTVQSAVSAGFDRVFSTIIDTNITTLVAAVFLYQFGTGPVKGFAVTLAIGLVANIFTATFVSRTIFNFFLQGRGVARLSI